MDNGRHATRVRRGGQSANECAHLLIHDVGDTRATMRKAWADTGKERCVGRARRLLRRNRASGWREEASEMQCNASIADRQYLESK